MMMLRAQLHNNSPVIEFVYKPITFMQNYLSMWRGWNMFAPNPIRVNGFVDAKITYADGSEYIWTFPRPQEGTLLERYIYGERYRKYVMDGLRLDSKSYLWPDGARFVLRKTAKRNLSKRPVSVTLRRRWKDIPNWEEEFIPHKSPPANDFNTFEFYTYEVN
jgi:hypothetical protein